MRANTLEGMWRFVKRGEGKACWPWTSGTFSGRYGRYSLAGQARLAHRCAYEATHGPISHGLFVMHKCNNKLCCNPDHLTLGSNSENQRHASASGVFPPGASGIQGVGFDRKRGYWVARAYRDGKAHNLYTGPHKSKAISARKKWDAQNLIQFQPGEKK